MASYINTNLSSMQAQRSLGTAQTALNTSVQRLSSGLRVNGAKDDAAGLAIATGMDKTVRGQSVAMRNANDAISFSQTTEGALGKVSDTMQRMRELAVQSANGTNSSDQRTAMDTEFKELQAEIGRVTKNTEFNGLKVLGDGASQKFQIGSNTTADNQIEIKGTDLSTTAATKSETSKLAIDADQTTSTFDITDVAKASAAIDQIDLALKEVSGQQTIHGAAQNRMSSVISTLQVSNENQSAARSRIMDTDFASETANLARNQILQQASTAMLGQANQLPNGVMRLLG
ncbi:flagellin FliC [Malikia spinosa]|uniref:Flagellin n=1 Tax=Malikia spinosa TaxID=86180 RepID=A0A2S9KDI0_9BURK|nr:flagellin [Malikia spinosa]PRD68462.1 flagellin FliC [Malikia spinosa]